MQRPAVIAAQRGRLECNMTPMIDVIFQLLIFFVCTASFQTPEQVLPTQLPSPGSVATTLPIDPLVEELEDVVIRVLDVGGQVQWEINQTRYQELGQVQQVLLAVAAVRNDLPVILDVDGAVALGHVIDLYDLCRLAGFRKIQFAAPADADAGP